MVDTLKNKKGTFLLNDFHLGHELSFLLHDIMTELLVSGEKGNFFIAEINLEENEYLEYVKDSDDLSSWFENTKKLENRAKVLKTMVLPAVLSDMLHCIYEALETSRKGKLNISYMLVRKPLQESLYLLEEIVLNELDFSDKLAIEPTKLESKNAGGVENHKTRIQKVLEIIGESNRLDASYIAELRYDKTKEDSFDGICNHAMHLFTNHKAIKTDKFNINFIFSNEQSKISQWAYLYSRLPYLLFYTLTIVEYITASIVSTTQEYLDDMQRRVSALIILWWDEIDDRYQNKKLEKLVKGTKQWLHKHCLDSGYKVPIKWNLIKMYKTGAFPNEKKSSFKARIANYEKQALFNAST